MHFLAGRKVFMEHKNPLWTNVTSTKKFITIGEIMLRLTPPNYEKIRLATNFEASYGGSEANIAWPIWEWTAPFSV